ncbi:hypothetical protein V7024_01395 [Bacillus sp. JJ864]|uniref:hypothetical protein n=1 Tax=Bacillus sp. JJ864 TaxID=3122975 RepID=UPI002FFE2566
MKFLSGKYNFIALGANILFVLCWVMILDNPIDYTSPCNCSRTERIFALILDVSQLVLICTAICFAVKALSDEKCKQRLTHLSLAISLAFLFLTVWYDFSIILVGLMALLS